MQYLQARRHSESGFTLIELLVVMLILGVLAAIVIPAFSKHDTKVVTAEVCGVSHSQVRLPEEAGGTYTLKTFKKGYYLAKTNVHGSFRFTLNTSEQTITSIESLGPKPNDHEIIRC